MRSNFHACVQMALKKYECSKSIKQCAVRASDCSCWKSLKIKFELWSLKIDGFPSCPAGVDNEVDFHVAALPAQELRTGKVAEVASQGRDFFP